MKGFILFPAYYINGELTDGACDIPMDADAVRVIGEGNKPAWSPYRQAQGRIRGMFIAYKGDEYGTIDLTETMIIDMLNNVNCCASDKPRIHVNEFAIEFV